jgi:hypothetical protein
MTEDQAMALREQFNLMRFRNDLPSKKQQLQALAADAPLFPGTVGQMFLSTPERSRALSVCRNISEVRDFSGRALKCEVSPSQAIPGQWEVNVFVRDDLDVSILGWRLRGEGGM